MVPLFVDRKRELEFLEQRYKEDGAQLIVIYGRRRIGKTELIKQFIRGKRALYHLSTTEGLVGNLRKLKEAMANFTGKSYFRSLNVNLDDLLIYFGDEIGGRAVLVIDEFQYLIEADRSVVSLVQRAWDERLKSTEIFLIITGSSVGMMENEVLSNRSPLYGRRTGSWKVTQLSFPYLIEFFPGKTMEELVKIWSVLGGVPFYLSQFDRDRTVEENVRNKVMRKGNVLYDEPLYLLREEFREQRVYTSILRALSQGYNTVSKISEVTGIDRTNLSSYLDRLEENEIVERVIPYGMKRGWYEIKDNFFEFWFRFVYSNISDLEIDRVDEVMERVDLNQYFSFKFEKLIRELIREGLLNLPFHYHYVGKYLHRGEEVDVVVEGKDAIFLGEVKWSDDVDARQLVMKMKRVMQRINEGKKEYYGVFARTLRNCEEVICYDLKELERTLIKGQ
ncbi:MAG: ATP-binding protein [Metallosphaera yellowstonensis]|uniref:Putative ATPase (AAA+ superfamily) n=2 Tax=Metallosphaera yellowstonensis MK1 TaxID=671065 RepID=H2C5J6_9CREN|nr:ATP-binding protein [Metallosphaera yellowstonensis]EHP69073.1 putative ATPase (AAA+ superfamily) [Metallosphaera yellowstonensis MK1]